MPFAHAGKINRSSGAWASPVGPSHSLGRKAPYDPAHARIEDHDFIAVLDIDKNKTPAVGRAQLEQASDDNGRNDVRSAGVDHRYVARTGVHDPNLPGHWVEDDGVGFCSGLDRCPKLARRPVKDHRCVTCAACCHHLTCTCNRKCIVAMPQ